MEQENDLDQDCYNPDEDDLIAKELMVQTIAMVAETALAGWGWGCWRG